jgi:hypothetical protein
MFQIFEKNKIKIKLKIKIKRTASSRYLKKSESKKTNQLVPIIFQNHKEPPGFMK